MNAQDKILVIPDEDLVDIIPGYLENRHKEMAQLKQAVTDGDFETLRILGHRMKGSGAGYGFDGITDIGRELEEGAKVNDAATCQAQVEALVSYLERVEVVYD